MKLELQKIILRAFSDSPRKLVPRKIADHAVRTIVCIVQPSKRAKFLNTVDCEIFVVKIFSLTTFSDENYTREIFCVTYVDLYQYWSLKSGDEIRLCEKFTSEIYRRKYPDLR